MPSVAADFIDLKSPYMAGHSRRCAQLGVDAAEVLGFGDGEITTLRRAALVHEFGTTAVPNSIWDKPGTLTRAEFDRVELHPMLTEQMLDGARRPPGVLGQVRGNRTSPPRIGGRHRARHDRRGARGGRSRRATQPGSPPVPVPWRAHRS
jgi:hypothetical protein